MTDTADVVACCASLAEQLATRASNHATASATSTQQTGLKALALLALARNNSCNSVATDHGKPRYGGRASKGDLLQETRAALDRIAAAEGIDIRLVRTIPDSDVVACAGATMDVQRSYVLALRDSALRERGKAPSDETAAALCAHCGPVWVHPAVAHLAPVVRGWPRLLGCPWCHVNDRQAIPRPALHFAPMTADQP